MDDGADGMAWLIKLEKHSNCSCFALMMLACRMHTQSKLKSIYFPSNTKAFIPMFGVRIIQCTHILTYTRTTFSGWNDDKSSVLNATLSKRYQSRFALGKQSITEWERVTAIFLSKICNILAARYHHIYIVYGDMELLSVFVPTLHAIL